MTTLKTEAPQDRDDVHVWISACEAGGWEISLEVDGRTVLSEHCTDWHRVERRRAFLRSHLPAQSHN